MSTARIRYEWSWRPETHLYATRDGGKLQPAHGYYRAQGWQAYLKGFIGLGYWALWDSVGETEPESGWSPFGGGDRDFGTLYAAPGGCAWPSRRLLAWRRGMEEYRILKYCEGRLGPAIVRQVAAEAIGRPGARAATEALGRFVDLCAKGLPDGRGQPSHSAPVPMISAIAADQVSFRQEFPEP